MSVIELDDLKTHLSTNPGVVIQDVARERKVTPHAVLEALPKGMARFGKGEGFVDAMRDIARWGDVTLIVHTGDAIFEFSGPVPHLPR